MGTVFTKGVTMKHLLIAFAISTLSINSFAASQETINESSNSKLAKVLELNKELDNCKTRSCSKKVLTQKVEEEYSIIFRVTQDYLEIIQSGDAPNIDKKQLSAILKKVQTLLNEVRNEKEESNDQLYALSESSRYYDGVSISIEIEEVHILKNYSKFLNTKLLELVHILAGL